MPDAFGENILGVQSLIEDPANKIRDNLDREEGVEGSPEDALELPMEDSELLQLRREWEDSWDGYGPKIKARQEKNKLYYTGKQRGTATDDQYVISANLIFEAEETFLPQALSQNPEPVVFSDNTDDGKAASDSLKTMLQYHSDVLCLRKKLALMTRHWSIYFLGVIKHGWDAEANDIQSEIRRPQNFLLDPEGFVDEFGDFRGAWLGERIQCSAQKLIDRFPKQKDYITQKVGQKLGTKVVYTEWWTNEYCFSTFEDVVLDKHKNEFFNYGEQEKTDEDGQVIKSATPALNHFAQPKMPYTFLSIFSLQEQPFDETTLIEQVIPDQNRITDREIQISKNLASANNSVKLSGISFDAETAAQAVESFYQEGFLLIPSGKMDDAQRMPANDIPESIFTAQSNDKLTLRQIFGTQGLIPNNKPDTAVRNNILAQQYDSSRIGGGVGDAIEQVADNIYNWWVQLYCVFYDEPHYGAVLGNGAAVQYIQLASGMFSRKFVVSVAPNSMAPKDEVSDMNQALQLATDGWLDPLTLFQKLDYPDPAQTALRVLLFKTNPQQYAAQFLGANTQQQQQMTPAGGGQPPQEGGSPPESLQAPKASSALSNVPLPQ